MRLDSCLVGLVLLSMPFAAQAQQTATASAEPYYKLESSFAVAAPTGGISKDVTVEMFVSNADKIANVKFSANGVTCKSDCEPDFCIVDFECGGTGSGEGGMLSIQLVHMTVVPQSTQQAAPTVEMTITPIDVGKLGEGMKLQLTPAE